MTDECQGSGRTVPDDEPSAEPMQCPVCGRAVKVDSRETGDGLRFIVESHGLVAETS